MDAVTRYEYALRSVRMDRFEDSEREEEAAVRADANLAEAHELLGGLLAAPALRQIGAVP